MDDLFESILMMLPILLPILWVAGCLMASLIYRKLKGKPIFYKQPPFTKFRQTAVSGYLIRSWLTWRGRAYNFLVVQVTESELDIHPFVPFNWFFLPEIRGLEYRVPLKNIISAKIANRLFGKGVEVEFKTGEGRIEKMFLVLKKPGDFLSAIDHLQTKEGQQFINRDGVITAKPIGPGA